MNKKTKIMLANIELENGMNVLFSVLFQEPLPNHIIDESLCKYYDCKSYSTEESCPFQRKCFKVYDSDEASQGNTIDAIYSKLSLKFNSMEKILTDWVNS